MKFKKIFIGLFTISAVFCLASCMTDPDPMDKPGEQVIAEYKVIFDSMGGSEVDTQTIYRGHKVTAPSNPTRSGYKFLGWYKDSSCVYSWNFEEDIVTGNVTLYAKWESTQVTPPNPEKYNVTYIINGHGTQPTNLTDVTALPAELPVLSSEGWTFGGWFTDAEFKTAAVAGASLTSNVTLYAKWTEKETPPAPEKYSVTYVINGHGVQPEKLTEVTALPIELPVLSAEGWIFEGWYTDAEFKNVAEAEATLFADATLYAKWTEKETPPAPDKYSVTYVINGHGIQPEKLTEVTALPAELPVLSAEGWTFEGWFSDAEFKTAAVAGATLSADATLYAKWEAKAVVVDKVKVTFDSNGGSAVSPVLVEVGSKVNKPAAPTRQGYAFKGWFNKSLDKEFNFDTDVIEGAITLYAKWEVSEYKVTFGGTSLDQQIVPVGGKITKPNPDPVKANHTFKGWFEDENYTKEWDFNTVITKSITIYAKWEEKVSEDEDEIIKFPFSSFHTMAQANLDSSTSKTNKELTTGPFTVSAGVKTEAAILNTQGKSVSFTLNGKISNGFTLTGTGASSNNTVTVTLTFDGKTLGTWEIGYGASKTISVDGLDSGTYTISTSGSIKINVFTLKAYNVPVEVVVQFNTNSDSKIPDVLANKWNTVTKPTDPTKDGYIFAGWYTDKELTSAFDFNTKLMDDTTLYAKWNIKPVDPNKPIFTIEYNPHGGNEIPNRQINEGEKFAAPDDPIRDGYIFAGWYDDIGYITPHDFTQPVTQNYTLHAKWEEKPLIISFVGADMEDINVYRGNTIDEPTIPEKPNYIFAGWYEDQAFTSEFDFNIPFTKDTTIYVKWEKDPDASDYVEGGLGTVGQKGTVEIIEAAGLTEAAFITFKKVSGASEYTISLKNSSGVTRVLNEKNVYFREVNGNMRADIMGVVPGTYEATILPVGTSSVNPSTATFSVGAYDRSGFAHFNYTGGVGAYNDDGSLKKNAIVLWVTDQNKNTIELSYNGVTVRGIGNILNSVGQDTGGGTTSNGGTPNTNQGIIRLLAENDIPLVVRFVGCVSNTGLYKKGTFNAGSAPKIDGLTIYDSTGHGGTEGDNGHMARMKSGKDITLEGVGEDAVIDGWGFHYMAESSAPDLGKSFEVRNLTFINTPEDAIGMEGVQASANVNSILTASVERCWIHNNEFYGPDISSPAESDKGEGDGSCDFKRGQYLTVSYNYFEGCHKTNLVGSSDSSLQFNLTYHHNLWYMCKARGPLARNANIHMYNNAFIGQTDYAMNTRANSYIFSEYNMFYMCKSPTAVESGAIKSYKDSVASYLSNKGSLATVVTDKSQKVSNNCQFASAGIRYDAFDTDPNLSYIPTNDYVLQTDVTLARKAIASKVGVSKDHPVAMTDITMSDISLMPSGTTVNNITTYPSSLTPGKMNKKVYAFNLDRAATVTLNCNEDAVLCNEAGVAMLEGNGSVVLAAGTYMVQPVNFQPGDAKAVTMGTFKDLTINSISFEEYNSEELNQQLIAQFETKVNAIPANITYTDACLSAINAAKEAYKNLSPELKTRVSASYAKVTTAYSNYLAAGVTYVEGLINAIGTVNANSGSAITSARAAYTTLTKTDSSVKISNLKVLTDAEAAFATYAIDSCIAKIEAIGTVTLDSKAAIVAARNEYNALSATDKTKITNRQKLFDAEALYANLEAIDNVTTLMNEVDLTNLESCQSVVEAYKELTTEQQGLIEDTDTLSDIFVAYVKLSIETLPATITIDDGDLIKDLEKAYQGLTAAEKAKVTNYSKLTAARAAYDAILSARFECTFNGAPSDSSVTVSGKYGATAATIDGTTYEKGLKMESSTSVSFSTTEAKTLTLHVTGGKKIKVDGTSYTVDSSGVLTVSIGAGNHTIEKDSTSTLLYAMFY
ncbi:MAG: InlB B-repeat-containing protein [Anaeroplasmataceae bacterium]|nr:InlB B-repeat-containing protein [Anaeroplasmataceae bacterium]